jgi:acylphosphatase
VSTHEAFSATVEGRVQGVGFRYSTKQQARRLGVTGYVQNRPDGTVYVECEGDPADVEQMARWLSDGPSGARVTNVDISWRSKKGHKRFVIQ